MLCSALADFVFLKDFLENQRAVAQQQPFEKKVCLFVMKKTIVFLKNQSAASAFASSITFCATFPGASS